MIKIEFKEAQQTGLNEICMFYFTKIKVINKFINSFVKDNARHHKDMKSITYYIPTQDHMLDREHILKLQGITKEQDEANQIEWSKL